MSLHNYEEATRSVNLLARSNRQHRFRNETTDHANAQLLSFLFSHLSERRRTGGSPAKNDFAHAACACLCEDRKPHNRSVQDNAQNSYLVAHCSAERRRFIVLFVCPVTIRHETTNTGANRPVERFLTYTCYSSRVGSSFGSIRERVCIHGSASHAYRIDIRIYSGDEDSTSIEFFLSILRREYALYMIFFSFACHFALLIIIRPCCSRLSNSSFLYTFIYIYIVSLYLTFYCTHLMRLFTLASDSKLTNNNYYA